MSASFAGDTWPLITIITPSFNQRQFLEATIFPCELAIAVGALDENNHQTMDYDLCGRLLITGAPVSGTRTFRSQGSGCTPSRRPRRHGRPPSRSLPAEPLVARAPHLSEIERLALVADLCAYRRRYWLQPGPLARLGLPPEVVLSLRERRAGLRRGAGLLARRTLLQQAGGR